DFQATGGVHNAALGTVDDVLITRTDIGRHNALDKIYGLMLQAQISARNKVIVFSGRISSEVLLKISKLGIGIIISTSAPTDLRSEEHTSELQSRFDLVCRLLLEKKKIKYNNTKNL